MRIGPAEYGPMRCWLVYVAPKVFPSSTLVSEIDPVAVLDRIASMSPAKARRGLSLAIGDLVEFTSKWSDGDVAALNQELLDQDLPSLTTMRARFSKTVARVTRRGRINDDDEFYAIRNAADMSESESRVFLQLIAEYEKKRSECPLSGEGS